MQRLQVYPHAWMHGCMGDMLAMNAGIYIIHRIWVSLCVVGGQVRTYGGIEKMLRMGETAHGKNINIDINLPLVIGSSAVISSQFTQGKYLPSSSLQYSLKRSASNSICRSRPVMRPVSKASVQVLSCDSQQVLAIRGQAEQLTMNSDSVHHADFPWLIKKGSTSNMWNSKP